MYVEAPGEEEFSAVGEADAVSDMEKTSEEDSKAHAVAEKEKTTQESKAVETTTAAIETTDKMAVVIDDAYDSVMEKTEEDANSHARILEGMNSKVIYFCFYPNQI